MFYITLNLFDELEEAYTRGYPISTDFAILLGNNTTKEAYDMCFKEKGFTEETENQYKLIMFDNYENHSAETRIAIACLRDGLEYYKSIDGDGVWVTMEWAEYPQQVASEKMQQLLEEAWKYQILDETGKTYTTKIIDKKKVKTGFTTETIKEYGVEGKKYVRVILDRNDKNSVTLSNGKEYKNKDHIWIEVNPIEVKFMREAIEQRTWPVPLNLMMSKKIVFPKIYYKHDSDFNEKFNNYFKETIPSKNIYLCTKKELEEKLEKCKTLETYKNIIEQTPSLISELKQDGFIDFETLHILQTQKLKSEKTDFAKIQGQTGIRPAIMYSEIKDKITKKERNKDGIIEVEYGEYPQNFVGSNWNETLERLWNHGLLNKNVKYYTLIFNKQIETLEEYEINVKTENGQMYGKYVRITNPVKNLETLSNSKQYKKGDVLWIEVEPVKFLVDETETIAIAKNIIFSTTSLDKEKTKEYMNTYLYNELNQNKEYDEEKEKQKIYRK